MQYNIRAMLYAYAIVQALSLRSSNLIMRQLPYIPNPSIPEPPPPALFCTLEMYCRLTVFHVAIYFSIHAFRQLSSFDDSELPGEGMHLSKQCELSFYTTEKC